MVKRAALRPQGVPLCSDRRLQVLPLAWLLLAGCILPAAAQNSGEQRCKACHKDLVSQFEFSTHSRLASFELHGHAQGCDACHGSPDKHLKTAGAKDIVSFKEATVADVERQCLGCHANRVGIHWKHGDHAMQGVTCVRCHRIHGPGSQDPADRVFLAERPMPALIKSAAPGNKASLAKPEAVLCLECHKAVGSRMLLSSRHPVREGRMKCSSCHDVHGTETGSLRTAERQNDLCLGCHTAKQGPFAFDHAPVSESCGACHVPHGSVNNNLLKQNEPFLCLQCHSSHFHIGRTGVTTPVNTITGGSQNPFGESGFRRAFGTKCTQCHSQIHGSNLPSQSITSRGKSLTR